MRTRTRESHLTHIRALPVGAEILDDGSVHFRVWAPEHTKVEVVLGAGDVSGADDREGCALEDEGNGYFSGTVAAAHAGSRYAFRVDDRNKTYPDPASRLQPDGPHGSSCVVDPSLYEWHDAGWDGARSVENVIYEMHLGTFTNEGTVAAAAAQLEELAAFGITVVELMPIADFPGTFGWGYDGVNLFAPSRLYGTPDDYRRFVDTAHGAGLAVILDVVYNHFGPDGNYLRAFASGYFTDKYDNEWSDAINFDGPNSQPVRELFIANAKYWIEEFHFDGFRFDATHQIFDASPTHILAEVAHAARTAAGSRRTLIIAENGSQQVRHVRSVDKGGFGFDAMWNDDLHHALMVRLTGRAEAYYADYRGTAQELLSAVKWGFLYQGQRSASQHRRHGSPAFDVEPSCFVTFLQNHDQIAHSGRGLRIHELASPALVRTATALLLLTPGTPMLFQGQEFTSHSRFLFFADHAAELAALVAEGRARFLARFPSLADPRMQAGLSDPSARSTFDRCVLDLSDRERNAPAYRFHKDLLALRKSDRVFHFPRRGMVDGAVLGDDAFVLRFFADDGADRLLLVNFGADLLLDVVPEPMLAPPEGRRWTMAWSSEDPVYGGSGVRACETEDGRWFIQGHAATVTLAQHAEPAES